MLPLLWLVQESEGYIALESEVWVAGLVGVGRSQVREVVSFYTMFHDSPQGRHSVRVCTNLSCSLRGARSLRAFRRRRSGSARVARPEVPRAR